MTIQHKTSRVAEARVRRRRVVVGPGLVLALLGSALLLRIRGMEMTVDVRPVVSDSAQEQQLRPTPPSPAPDLAFVLRERDTVHLSDRQTDQLKRLEKQFDRETAEDRVALAQASAEFARQMRDEGPKPTLLPDIQERTAAVSQLSRRLSATRRAYWTRATQILAPEQAVRAETLWVHQLDPRGEAVPGLQVNPGAAR